MTECHGLSLKTSDFKVTDPHGVSLEAGGFKVTEYHGVLLQMGGFTIAVFSPAATRSRFSHNGRSAARCH